MKKIAFLLIMFLATLQLVAQSGKLVPVPGTRVSLSLLPGFKLAEEYSGIYRDEATGVQVFDMWGSKYANAIAGFTKDEMQQRGAVIYSYNEVKVDGYEARFAIMQGDSGTRVATVIFGDTAFTTMIVAAYPETDIALEKQMEQTLLGAKYNKKTKVDPFALSYFKLNDTNSKYKYASTANNNIFIYSLNGEVKESYMGASALTAMPINSDTVLNAETLAATVLTDMKKYGLNDAETTYKSSKPINGLKTYEIITYGTVANEKHAVYHMAVVKGNKGFVIQGIAVADFEITIQQFEALAHTVTAR